MIVGGVSVVAFLAAAAAVAWPYIGVLSRAKSLSPSERAYWVTRLFALASLADEIGDGHVSAAARALISSLVSENKTSAKGR